MEIKAKELFLKNYSNQGDCEGLMGFAKNFDKDFKSGTKKKISYLPWAIVERIFRLQGGKVEVADWNLEIPFKATLTMPNENGEIITAEKISTRFFTTKKELGKAKNLKNFYPIFDKSNRAHHLLPDRKTSIPPPKSSVRLMRDFGHWLIYFRATRPIR